MANYTVTITGTGSSNSCCVNIDGAQYIGRATLTVAENTAILVVCSFNGNITMNGETVEQDEAGYTFTLTNNATISLDASDMFNMSVEITMDKGGSGSEGGTDKIQVNITRSGDSSSNCYALINGTKYSSATTLEIEAGTTIECSVTTGTITLNGATVATDKSYSFVPEAAVVNIDLYSSRSWPVTHTITITTEGKLSIASHSTLIDGTAYEITGGKVMVGGTVYDIAGGKTLLGGTVYEIAFAPSTITVNITGTGYHANCYVTINGTNYTAATTLEIEPGTEISITANGASSANRQKCWIKLNGTTVATGSTAKGASYSFAPDASVVNIKLFYNRYSEITITTE